MADTGRSVNVHETHIVGWTFVCQTMDGVGHGTNQWQYKPLMRELMLSVLKCYRNKVSEGGGDVEDSGGMIRAVRSLWEPDLMKAE